MWYTKKAEPDKENSGRELAVYMSHPGSYLKGKETKVFTVINSKVVKVVMACDSNCATNKEKIECHLSSRYN